jgi:CRISPR-associated protein Csx1
MYRSHNENFKAYTLFSDPIYASNKNETKNVYVQKINTKAFFDFPISKDYLNEEKLKTIDLNKEEIKMCKRAYYSFRAVKNNAPLLIYTFGYDSPENIEEVLKNLSQRYSEMFEPMENKYIENDNIVYKIPSAVDLRVGVFLSLALYHSLSKSFRLIGIPEEGKEWVPLSDINRFREIYSRYSLKVNEELLKRDIEGVKKLSTALNPGEEAKLCLLERNKQKGCNKEINKRNFWAHSGFERNITLLRKDNNGQIKISYASGYRDRLKNMLLTQ